VPFDIARDWAVLTSYDNLLAYAHSKGGRLPTEPELRLFLDMYDVGHVGGANVGFRNWHVVPATMGGDVDGGRGSNGGVWEWTSTPFQGHEGMAPTKLFPGYSTDFFDGVHHVVLGASYATVPRLAGRSTVRNFYQHNYPYPWVGARVVYDV
jgi:L-histidine Nalpha-methyltransferase / hercynylcysteine S-oxide synthase